MKSVPTPKKWFRNTALNFKHEATPSQNNGAPSIFLLSFFATQIIGGAKELVVLL